MEDVHTYIANFAERVDWGYFAIFDGHAGKDTARWWNNLHTLLEEEIDRNSDEGSPPPTPITGKDDLREDLYKCFVKADELIEKVDKVNLDVLLQWLFSDGKVIMKNQYRTPRAKMVVNLISSQPRITSDCYILLMLEICE